MNNYVNVLLYFSGVGGGRIDMKKSNFWITMLFFGYLSNVITGICVNDIHRTVGKTLVIIPDDVSYSGGQYKSVLNSLSNRIEENQDIFAAIPYISNKALGKIKKKEGLKSKVVISKESEIFYSIEELIDKDEDMTERKLKTQHTNVKRKLWKDLTTISRNLHPIYFDHKLADMASIYQDIYALGRPLNSKYCNNWEEMSLIDNCGNAYDIGCDERFMDLQNNVGWKKMCPSPFYKGIEYTYNGERVNTMDDIL